MTRRGQWVLLLAIVAMLAGVVGVTTYGLRDEIFPVDAGTEAPDFEAVTLFDHDVKSLRKDYAGQVVLVNIWATWCGPCRVEMPSIEALNKEFGPKGLKIIGINAADPEASDSLLKAFADGYGLTFEILRDMPAAGKDSITRTYKTTAFPETFVIDKSGLIRKKWIGPDDWTSQGNRSLIASLLGLPVPQPDPVPVIGDTAIPPRGK